MVMSACCSICSEWITKQYHPEPKPGEPIVHLPFNFNAMVTPCGHAYHTFCLTQWMGTQAGTHGSCPNCRKIILNKKCNPLFLDVCDVTFIEPPIVDILQSEVATLTNDLAQKEVELIDLKKSLDYWKGMYDKLSTEFESVTKESQRQQEIYDKLSSKHHLQREELKTSTKKLVELSETLEKLKNGSAESHAVSPPHPHGLVDDANLRRSKRYASKNTQENIVLVDLSSDSEKDTQKTRKKLGQKDRNAGGGAVDKQPVRSKSEVRSRPKNANLGNEAAGPLTLANARVDVLEAANVGNPVELGNKKVPSKPATVRRRRGGFL